MSDHKLAEQFDSPLGDFQEGQWWVLELDAAAQKHDATSDFKRAVAVVHHLLRAIAAHSPNPASGTSEQQAGEAVAWHVVDADGQLMHAAGWKEAAHEHINDALNEYGIAEAAKWRVIPVFTRPQKSLTECAHHYVRDDDAPTYHCCQKCGKVTKDTK